MGPPQGGSPGGSKAEIEIDEETRRQMDHMVAKLGFHRVNRLPMGCDDANEDDISYSKRRNRGEPSRRGGPRSAEIGDIRNNGSSDARSQIKATEDFLASAPVPAEVASACKKFAATAEPGHGLDGLDEVTVDVYRAEAETRLAAERAKSSGYLDRATGRHGKERAVTPPRNRDGRGGRHSPGLSYSQRSPSAYISNRNDSMKLPLGLSALEEAKWFRDNVQGKSGSKGARGGLASRGIIAKRGISSSTSSTLHTRFPTAGQLNTWPNSATSVNFSVPTRDKRKENMPLRKPLTFQGYMTHIAVAGSEFTSGALGVNSQATKVQKSGIPASPVRSQSSAQSPTASLEAGSSLALTNRDQNLMLDTILPSIWEQDMIEFRDSSVLECELGQSASSISQLIILGGSNEDNSGIAVDIQDDLQELMDFFVHDPASINQEELSTELTEQDAVVEDPSARIMAGIKADGEVLQDGVAPGSNMVALRDEEHAFPPFPVSLQKAQVSHDFDLLPALSTVDRPAGTSGLASSRWDIKPMNQKPVAVPAKAVAKKSGLSSSRWAPESSANTPQPSIPQRKGAGCTTQAAIESFHRAEPSKIGIFVKDSVIVSKWADDASSNKLMPHLAPRRPLTAAPFDMIKDFRDGQDRQEVGASADTKRPACHSVIKHSAIPPLVMFTSNVKATECFTTAKDAKWRAKGRYSATGPSLTLMAGTKQLGKHAEPIERTLSWLDESTFADLGWQDGAISSFGEFSFWKTTEHSKEKEDDKDVQQAPHESCGSRKLLTMNLTPAKKLRRKISLMECAAQRVAQKLELGDYNIEDDKLKEQHKAIVEQIQKLKQELAVMMDDPHSHERTEQELRSLSKPAWIQSSTVEGETSAFNGDLRESVSCSNVRGAAKLKIDDVNEKEFGFKEASSEMPDGQCMRRSELRDSASHKPIVYAHSPSKLGDAVRPVVPMSFQSSTAKTLPPRKAWFESVLASPGLRKTGTGLSNFQRELSTLEKDWNLSDSDSTLMNPPPRLDDERAYESDRLISVSPQNENKSASVSWRYEAGERKKTAEESKSGNLSWLSLAKNEILESTPGAPLTVKGRLLQDDPFVDKSLEPMERTSKSKSKRHGEMGVMVSFPSSGMLTACHTPSEALEKGASTVQLTANTKIGESVYIAEAKKINLADPIASSKLAKREPVAESVEANASPAKKLTSKKGLSSSRWATNEADDGPKTSGNTNESAVNISEMRSGTLRHEKDGEFPAAAFNDLLLSQVKGVKEPVTASSAVSKAKPKKSATKLKQQMRKDVKYCEAYTPQTGSKYLITACPALTLLSPAPPHHEMSSPVSSPGHTAHCDKSPDVTHQAPTSSDESAIAFAQLTSQRTTFMDVARHTIQAPVTCPTSFWAVGMVPDSNNPGLIRSVECILDGSPWVVADSPGIVRAKVTVLENGRMVKSIATLTAPPWDEHNNLWHAELFPAFEHMINNMSNVNASPVIAFPVQAAPISQPTGINDHLIAGSGRLIMPNGQSARSFEMSGYAREDNYPAVGMNQASSPAHADHGSATYRKLQAPAFESLPPLTNIPAADRSKAVRCDVHSLREVYSPHSDWTSPPSAIRQAKEVLGMTTASSVPKWSPFATSFIPGSSSATRRVSRAIPIVGSEDASASK